MADLEKVAQILEVQISRESSKTLLHFQKMKFEAYKGREQGVGTIYQSVRLKNSEF